MTSMILNPGERLTPEFLEKLNSIVNAEENPTTYLGIDPGGKNGIGIYDARFYLQFIFTIAADDMVRFLLQFNHVKTAVVEDYRLFPNKAKQQYYSDMETPRVIGRIETWAEMNNVELVKQGPSIKDVGYAWIGQKKPPKSDKRNHEKDGNVHFMYWAIKNKHIDARSLL